jgi:crotonobetainyl-CoA:carnitine CoA-transferase CaiB-like acyl-CoA transferase
VGLLDGLRVADASDDVPEDAGHIAGRILSDLGADVVLVEPPGGCPARHERPLAFAAWNAGKRAVAAQAATDVLRRAHVVLAGRVPVIGEAPQAVWVAITPFGLAGPRARWRGSDLTIVAAGANLYPTGDPDRPPVRCTEPTSAAHTAPEAVVAALTALATGRPQVVDVSMQETHLMANMGGPARYPLEKDRGRRRGAYTGRTRETWRCADGWVSFGLRGGAPRVRNLQTLTALAGESGVHDPALSQRDWTDYNHRTVSDDELAAISAAVQAFFDRHTMAELYDMAVRTGLMLAPANSPREILASPQLATRGFFAGDPPAPRSFVVAGPDGDLVAPRGEPPAAPHDPPGWPEPAPFVDDGSERAWAGVHILEFGSGAAGPIATGYFADHGATVVRIESRARPDFLRSYSLRPGEPDTSAFFAVLNPGKRSVCLDLKNPRAQAAAYRLVEWADVVADNFAPGAMDRLGLGREQLRRLNPQVIIASACLQGQTGPHRDYPGFGGQGAALSGYTYLTGWPDRAPVGPAGTITDSLAPRFSAAAICAALLYRRRTGEGVDLDLSQVEAASWTLSPWLMAYARDGKSTERAGNRRGGVAPHGVFPCRGEDRWVALAVWDDAEWARLAKLAGIDIAGTETAAARLARVDEIEQLVAAWTSERNATDLAALLQAEGLEAYPVLDWADALDDPQLVARGHFVPLTHPVIGEHLYERRGFRLDDAGCGPAQPAPTLGQHTRAVLSEFAGLAADEIDALAAEGAL